MIFDISTAQLYIGITFATPFLVATLPVAFLLYLFSESTSIKSIPGPWSFPILGNAAQLYSKPHLKFMQWSKIYGPIFEVTLFNKPIVVINDAKLIKKLFSNRFTTGRSLSNPIIHEMTKGCYGLANSQGRFWSEQRFLALKILQQYGFNMNSMETLITEEVKATLDWLAEREGLPIQAVGILDDPIINILWNIVAGQRWDWENGKSEVLERLKEMLGSFQRVNGNLLGILPSLRNIFPELLGWNEYVDKIAVAQEIFKDEVERKRMIGGKGGNDFISFFIAEIENTTDSNSSFYQELGYHNLIAGLFDLFIGNTDSTSLTLVWALLYLTLHPEIQAEVHSELDIILGNPFICPTLSYRPKLPILEAVIMETMRMSSIVPLGLPHRVTQDFIFKSFTLKRGTTLIANLYGAHHDPNVWGDPENFKPSRFLNSDKSKVVHTENLIPYSSGKRKCIGESMAQEEIFLFLSGILNRYKVEMTQKCSEKGTQPESGNGILTPPKFDLVFIPRSM